MGKKKLTDTVIISEELMKLHSGMSKNLPIDKVFPFCILAQNYFIEPILGLPLLEELQEQVEDDSLTIENKALIIKIAPCLALYTEYLAMRSLAYSVTAKGITLEKSENSQPISEKELGELILDIKNRASMAQELLIKYLCRCKDLYSLWRPEQPCICEKYEPTEGDNHRNFGNEIYFPNKINKSCCKCNK
jgi:hypothetical protein